MTKSSREWWINRFKDGATFAYVSEEIARHPTLIDDLDETIRVIEHSSFTELEALAEEMAKALEGVLESKALQEAPLYEYSEAVIRCREVYEKWKEGRK